MEIGLGRPRSGDVGRRHDRLASRPARHFSSPTARRASSTPCPLLLDDVQAVDQALGRRLRRDWSVYNVHEPTGRLDSAYVDALSQLPAFAQEVVRRSKGVWSSRLRLYPDGFFEISLPVPPLSEQRQVAADLVAGLRKTGRIAQGAATCAIELLEERRAALSDVAVTGRTVANGSHPVECGGTSNE